MSAANTFMEFSCPKCRGHTWGSTHDGLLRHCHTDGCLFEWRIEDDWQYFRQVTVVTFESPVEYKKADRALKRLYSQQTARRSRRI